jgi:hypothetical protein
MLRVVTGGLDRLPAGEMSGPTVRGRRLILVAANFLNALGKIWINLEWFAFF